MGEISLAGEWMVTWEDGLHGKTSHAVHPVEDEFRYISMNFPGSIHTNLEKLGIIEDPRIGINSLKARWVEEHFWILRKKFYIPEEAVNQSPRLIIEVLDGVGQVFVNGFSIGGHANSHRPVNFNLDFVLQPGLNEIVVLLESGLFKVAELPGRIYSISDETILTKRHHLRQPQYQFGWDWNPRLIFMGIHGDVSVQWGEIPRLDQVSVTTTVPQPLDTAYLTVKTNWFMPGEDSLPVELSLAIDDKIVFTEILLLAPGCSSEMITHRIQSPKLWFPRGYGDQILYHLELTASSNGTTVSRWVGNIGVRKVEIIQEPHPIEGKYFHIVVNNQPVFCKGANWVPPEMSAYEVSSQKIDDLVNLAINQNFNTLRIWGGGVWAGHELLELCDRHGIMVWHDLLFACSKYPADNPEFLKEVQTEITWGLQEYSYHPSLVVWCGNNELEWGLWSWNYKDFGITAPDYVLFHHIIPGLIQNIDPDRPYWPSSPYTGAENEPNDPTQGDQHPWRVSIIDPDTPEDVWQYRHFVDRFPNEGGVLGLSPYKSLQEFLGEGYLKFRSFSWEHHDNTINFMEKRIGVAYMMLIDWFGKSFDGIRLEDLVLASGLIQAEGLKEYIRNYRRRWPSSASAIYWDYVDSWPSVHGWGSLDYYLRKKPAFYAVRKANQDVIVVLGEEDTSGKGDDTARILIYVVNDSESNTEVLVKAGNFTPQGELKFLIETTVRVNSRASVKVATIERDEAKIAFAMVYDGNNQLIDWDRMLFHKVKHLHLEKPKIKIETRIRGGKSIARYSCDSWVWGVFLDVDGEAQIEENVFDLFPGIPFDIELDDGESPRPVIITGNEVTHNILGS